MPPDHTPDTQDPLEGCTHLAVVLLGAVIAPIAAGLTLGAAATVNGEVVLAERCHPPRSLLVNVNNPKE